MTFLRIFLFYFMALPACLAMGEAPRDPNAPTIITAGAFASPGSPWWNDWQSFNANIKAAAPDGSIKVKLLINGEAGGEPATLTFTRRNRMQIAGVTLGGTSSIVPEVDVLLSPFFFDSTQQLDFVMDEYLMPVFRELFAAKGLYLLQWVEVGWLNLYGLKPMTSPTDVKGRRMRVQSSEAAELLMMSLGAEYLQMEFADVIPALQTGLIFGGETNVVLYEVTGLVGEAPHMTFTQHSYDTGVVVANLEWYNALPEKRRQIITGSLVPSPQARLNIRTMAAKVESNLESYGVIAHMPTPAERAAWKEATKDNHKAIINRVGGRAQDVYNAMVKGRAAFNAQRQSR
ncbi:MAG: TRAP transporter substrate-binding protein DctP [Pseudomonadota bacterium]